MKAQKKLSLPALTLSAAGTMMALALFLGSCLSQPEGKSPEASAPALPRYAEGIGLSQAAEPPQELIQLMAASADTLAPKALPLYSEGLLLFALKASGAKKVFLSADFILDYERDELKAMGDTGWFWAAYSMASDTKVSYAYEVMGADGEQNFTRDPLNPGVNPDPNFENLHDPSRSSRFELFSLPYEIPGRARPDRYSISNRQALVYLPAGYDAQVGQRYPVIYMQDGLNAWDAKKANWGGWKADRALDALIDSGQMEKVIVVAIFNNGYRTEEYAGAGVNKDKAGADQRSQAIAEYYRDWCADILKPAIDARYRTKPAREETAVIGSSYGGCIAIYWSLGRPDVYGKAAALSYAHGSNSVVDGGMTALARETYLPALSRAKIKPPRLWLDCGLGEGPLVDVNRALDDVLRAAGFTQGSEYHFELFERAIHNEQAWAKRLPQILTFLFPPR